MTSITCSNCNQDFFISDGMSVKKFEDGVTAYGLTCPHCKKYSHSYFETRKIIKLRQDVQIAQSMFGRSKSEGLYKLYLDKRKELNQEHDRVQEKYSHLLETM